MYSIIIICSMKNSNLLVVYSINKIRKWLYVLCACIALISCDNQKSKLNTALNLAGDNKEELEKVLNHFKALPSDSLKYKAAVFLIENIPYHKYKSPIVEFNKVFDSIQNYPKNKLRRGVFENILDSVSKIIHPRNSELIYDVKRVDSNFLINNIELAFNAWYRIPKDKRASFDEFCEYILPYRSTKEPIEFGLRKKLNDKYFWVYDELNKGASLKSVVDSITSEFKYENFGNLSKYYNVPLSLSQIEKSRIGLCDDGVNYLVNVFRSLGIICSKEYVSHWGNHHTSGHSWIYTKYGNQEYSTNINGQADLRFKYEKESIPKVNRTTFSHQNNFVYSSLAIDVTSNYVSTVNLNIENTLGTPISQPVICVFDRYREWASIGRGIVKENGKIYYKDLGVNVLYMVASKKDNDLVPFNYPFFIDNNKKVHFFKPIFSKNIKIGLTRKNGLSSPRNRSKLDWIKSLNGSLFIASNNLNFKNSKTLLKVSNINSPQYHKLILNNDEKFQYLEFQSKKVISYFQKIIFLDKDDKQIKASFIEKNGEYMRNDMEPFIGSFSYSNGSFSHFKLKFEKPENIASITIQPRNDGNHIYIGDTYELLYWDKNWKSLGTKIAKDTSLYYTVPKNSLLWLRNHTAGIEEHVFTIDERGKQKWLGFDNY